MGDTTKHFQTGLHGLLLPTSEGWQLPLAAGPDEARLPWGMPDGLNLRDPEPVEMVVTLYDSWEWTLWHAGLRLVGDGVSVRLFDATKGELPKASLSKASPPRFVHDQPSSPWRDRVAPLLKLRALTKVAQVPVVQRTFDVCNADDKTVVRLIEHVWNDRLRMVALSPLRGYEDEAAAVRKALPKPTHAARSGLHHALEVVELQPRRWTNKPGFAFTAQTPARKAVGEMLATMVTLARETEAGTVEDIDTEFLHDYRVLIRKARSVLSLTRGVLSAEATASLKTQLSALGRRTNALRDFDVHLLSQPIQEAAVPEPLRASLRPLFEDIALRRGKAHAQLRATLTGSAYGRSLEALLEEITSAEPGPRAEWTTRKLADKKVSSQLKKVQRQGRAITDQTPDEDVHALRIECKKLRYLLEFFRGLYPDAEVSAMVKVLKRLQDVLGDFNDYSVQQEQLYAWLDQTSRLS
ncbi:MAG: CHAD domain-containing protein, partial [Myxococcota bacterium]